MDIVGTCCALLNSNKVSNPSLILLSSKKPGVVVASYLIAMNPSTPEASPLMEVDVKVGMKMVIDSVPLVEAPPLPY
ncbi:hypothetical protein V6N12_067832 [Hibiscus sabdariffa]|uniref:Uncharacterized protein n=1 Tax=Hibiscus sabdariffa TaxID=183260 RepID=A0ABR2FNM5_9ROSI